MVVIVPLDFSENSIKALEFALAIAEKRKAKIILVHALEGDDGDIQQSTAPDLAFAQVETQLKNLIEKYRISEIEMEYEITYGNLATHVVGIAKDKELPLIVMGTQGLGGIKKSLIGCTTVSMISEAKSPVLVIPTQANVLQIKKVTLALEFADHEEKFIDWIVDMSRRWELGLEILHVQSNTDFKGELAVLGMEGYLKKKYPGINTRIHTFYSTSASEGLELYMEEQDNMILVMSREHQNLWEQILQKDQSTRMSFHTHVPLLIMP